MAWARIDDDFPNHPKVWRVGAEGVALFVEGLCHASKFLTDGFLAKADVERMRLVRKPLAVAGKLVEVGLWEGDGENFRIHDYHDYNQTSDVVRERRASNRARVTAWRGKRDESSTNAPSNALRSTNEHDPARAGAPEARGRAVGRDGISSVIPEGESEGKPIPPPLVNQSIHRKHAFCGHVCVPVFCHERYVKQRGGDSDMVRAWYLETDTKWAGTPVGDKPENFWDARFAEWVGTTVGSVKDIVAAQQATRQRQAVERNSSNVLAITKGLA